MLLLTNTQVLRISKTFSTGSSANIKFLKTQLPKMIQLGGFLGSRLWTITKNWFAFDRKCT